MFLYCAGPFRSCCVAVFPLGFVGDPTDGTPFCRNWIGVFLAYPEHRTFQFLFYAFSNSFASIFWCLFSARGASGSTMVMGGRSLASGTSRPAGAGIL